MISTLMCMLLSSALLSQPSEAPARDAPQLDQPAIEAMIALLDKERESQATYDAILAEHRPIPPFARVVRDEAAHEEKLMAQFERLGIEVPENAWAEEEIDVPADADAARALGVKLEKETVAAYDEAIKAVRERELRSSLRQLRVESRQHVRMFERGCCGGGGGQGQGFGRGAGAGRGAGVGPRAGQR